MNSEVFQVIQFILWRICSPLRLGLVTIVLGFLLVRTGFSGADDTGTRFLRQRESTPDQLSLKLGFLFQDQLQDDSPLKNRVDEAQRNGFGIIVAVDSLETFNQEDSQRKISECRDEFKDLIIVSALAWDFKFRQSNHSLIALFPQQNDEFKRIHKLTEVLKSHGDHEFEERRTWTSLNWLESNYQDADITPILLYYPKPWIGSTDADIVEVVRSLKKETHLLTGYPVMNVSNEHHQESNSLKTNSLKNLENSWDLILNDPGLDIHAAFSIFGLSKVQANSEPLLQPATWMEVSDHSIRGVLDSFQRGASFVSQSGIVTKINLSVEASGLERPAVIGEEIYVSSGRTVQIKIQCEVPVLDSRQQSNWLDDLEVITTANGNTERQRASSLYIGESIARWEITVPPGGMVLRGCVRRKINGEDSLVALTDYIRIRNRDETLPISSSGLRFWLNSLLVLQILCTAIGILISATLWKLLFRRRKRQTITISKPLHNKGRDSQASPDFEWAPPEKVISAPQVSPETWQFLSRRDFAIFALGLTVFAVYGLFVPLNYREISFQDAVEKFKDVPYLKIGLGGRQDWVANLLLFVPLGYLWSAAILLDQKRIWLSRLITLFSIPTVLAGLAIGTEFFQLWFPPRTVSQNDIYAEIIGGTVGSVLAVLTAQFFVDWSRKYIEKMTIGAIVEWFLWTYLGFLLLTMLMPFDFVLSTAELQRKYIEGRLSIGIDRPTLDGLTAQLLTVFAFVPVGIWASQLRRLHGQPKLLTSLLTGISIALIYELLQIPVYSRSSSVISFLSGTVGVLIGGIGSMRYSSFLKTRFRLDFGANWQRAGVGVACCIIYMAVLIRLRSGSVVFELSGNAIDQLRSFWQIPFSRLYWGTELNAFFVIAKNLVALTPVGFILGDIVITSGSVRRSRIRVGVGVILISLFATSLEFLQALSDDHFCDVTDAILLAWGGIAGLAARLLIVDLFTSHHFNREFSQTNFRILTALSIASVSSVLFAGAVGIQLVEKLTEHILTDEARLQLAVESEATSNHLRVQSLKVPTLDHSEAIWGSTGIDNSGNIWLGISDGGSPQPNARILKFDTNRGEIKEQGRILSQLKMTRELQPKESQAKVHTKFYQAEDGFLYFASMDEEGEASDGSRLPIWGSHLWRLNPRNAQFEHLAAFPEGLIAISGSGRWIYTLGLFDHILYQYDIQTREINRVQVGSVGGHISRNFLTDARGHVYVPSISYYGDPLKKAANPVKSSPGIRVDLVEYSPQLRQLSSTPLEHYLTESYWTNHGITGFTNLSNGTILFTTSAGHIYRIIPRTGLEAATVQALGWFHPKRNSYAPSLFELVPDKIVGGVAEHKGVHEWVEFDLTTFRSETFLFPLPKTVNSNSGLLLYGSQTQDIFGACYVAGRLHNTPVLLRVSRYDLNSESMKLPASVGPRYR